MKLVKTQIRRTAGTCICTRSKISQETPDIRSSGHYYLNPRLHTCPLSSASNTPGPDICTATRQPVLHLWVVITPEPNKLHTCIWPICVSLLVAGCFLLMHALQPMVLSPITSMISSRDSSNTSRRRVAKKYINNSFFPCHFLIIRHQAVREASQADRESQTCQTNITRNLADSIFTTLCFHLSPSIYLSSARPISPAFPLFCLWVSHHKIDPFWVFFSFLHKRCKNRGPVASSSCHWSFLPRLTSTSLVSNVWDVQPHQNRLHQVPQPPNEF